MGVQDDGYALLPLTSHSVDEREGSSSHPTQRTNSVQPPIQSPPWATPTRHRSLLNLLKILGLGIVLLLCVSWLFRPELSALRVAVDAEGGEARASAAAAAASERMRDQTEADTAKPPIGSTSESTAEEKISSQQEPRTRYRVGPRQFGGLYSGCTSSELLADIGAARIAPDGISRYANKWTTDVPPLEDFEFSYSLPTCPQPHLFTPEETCDLLNAFGGVYMRGDSLVRHMAQGLFILMSQSSHDALWDDVQADCTGDKVFSDKSCRFASKFDSRDLDLAARFCAQGEVAPVRFQLFYAWVADIHPTKEHQLVPYRKRVLSNRAELSESASVVSPFAKLAGRPLVSEFTAQLLGYYNEFLDTLAPAKRKLSPVYIHGTGIHYGFKSDVSEEYHALPFLNYTAHTAPPPFAIWALNPAPGKNKPAKYLPKQGPEWTREYNERMRVILEKANREKGMEGEGWTAIDYFNSTDGAKSFDGTHYAIQVTMERVQVLLNYLDVVWSEVVELGGLVDP